MKILKLFLLWLKKLFSRKPHQANPIIKELKPSINLGYNRGFANAVSINHGGGTPEYHPDRTKFKGYMRENRRNTFNKNR